MRHDIPVLIKPGHCYRAEKGLYVYPNKEAAKRGQISVTSTDKDQAECFMSERLGVTVKVAPSNSNFVVIETENYFRDISLARVQFLNLKFEMDECWIVYRGLADLREE